MSVVYRSNVGDMSVNCRWHIGQLSVADQSCVHLAGESNGFPFERLSIVIMLLGKMLQREARLLYKANRWALRTMGTVIFSFEPIVSSIGQVTAKCRRSVGEVSAKCRSSIGQVSAKCRPSVGEESVTWKAMSADIHLDRLSTDYRPTIDWVATESQSSVDRLSIDCRPSGDRVSTATSTDITVDITYSKHDPQCTFKQTDTWNKLHIFCFSPSILP